MQRVHDPACNIDWIVLPAHARLELWNNGDAMSTIREQLLDWVQRPDAFDLPHRDLEEMQLAAARELFAQHRGQIKVLDKRARDTGVGEVRTLQDLVPLLFAHTVYKSYPGSFVEKGQWDRLLQWLQTLAVPDVSNTDIAGVRDVDEWIERLREAGHFILATSGTTGKNSFLLQTMADHDRRRFYFRHAKGWPYVKPNQDRPFFALGPSRGPTSLVETHHLHADVFGRPGAKFFLTDEPIRIGEINRMAQFRQAMAEGRVTPAEIQAAEQAAQARSQQMEGRIDELTRQILAHRHEPIYVSGMYAQHMMILERARALGAGDGEFHPDSLIHIGGGVKNSVLPPDYREQVARFWGKVHNAPTYGMTEMGQALVRCEARRYHRAPGLVMLVLDRAGDRLLTPADAVDGKATGRMGFLDLLFEGRWGGLITGDKVTIDFSERCECGRHGPTLLDDVTRFSQPGENDHIGCAGTLDAYIRGALAA